MASLCGQLLPGIPDDVTLANIATQLPWTAFEVLSSVSRAWKRAIESREVYRERIRFNSTETLVVVKHDDVNDPYTGPYIANRNSISLYSMREKRFYRLPPIPQLERGISQYSQFVSVEGKLYVFGARSAIPYKCFSRGGICYEDWQNWGPEQRMEVYELDLAGHRQWRKCTYVQEPEREYTVSTGGAFKVGETQIVRGGCRDWFRSFWHVCDSIEDEWGEEDQDWRVVEAPWEIRGTRSLYVEVSQRLIVRGKVYRIGSLYHREENSLYDGEAHSVYVYDHEAKAWTHLQSISCSQITTEIAAALQPSHWPLLIHVFFILPVNNELVALARWTRCVGHGVYHMLDDYAAGCCVIQTKGFGTQSTEIAWEKAPHNLTDFGSNDSVAICPIEL